MSWGQKPKKKKIKHPLNHHMLFGRVSRKIRPHSSKNKLQQIQLSDTTGTSLSDETEKNSFLAATPPDEFSTNRDKMSTVKFTAGSLMLWACFSAGGPGHLVQMHGIMDSIKYQQIKNLNLTASVRNLIMGHVLIFQQDNNPKQTSK